MSARGRSKRPAAVGLDLRKAVDLTDNADAPTVSNHSSLIDVKPPHPIVVKTERSSQQPTHATDGPSTSLGAPAAAAANKRNGRTVSMDAYFKNASSSGGGDDDDDDDEIDDGEAWNDDSSDDNAASGGKGRKSRKGAAGDDEDWTPMKELGSGTKQTKSGNRAPASTDNSPLKATTTAIAVKPAAKKEAKKNAIAIGNRLPLASSPSAAPNIDTQKAAFESFMAGMKQQFVTFCDSLEVQFSNQQRPPPATVQNFKTEQVAPTLPVRRGGGGGRGRGGFAAMAARGRVQKAIATAVRRGGMAGTAGGSRGRGGGGRGGRVGTLPGGMMMNPGAMMANPNEPIQVFAMGSKVGVPYTGPQVAVETITNSLFTLKNGNVKAPILFVIANNNNNTTTDAAFLARVILAGGGHVITSVDTLPLSRINLPVASNLAFCVAERPNESPDFLFGVAYGARCVSTTWVLECAAHGRLLDHSDYLLAAGTDAFGRVVLQHRRRQIFGGRKIVVAGGSNLWCSRWAKVVFAAGGTATCIPGDGGVALEGDDEKRIQEASYVVVGGDAVVEQLPAATSALGRVVARSGKSFVTVSWLIQSLICGKVIDPSCHPTFTCRQQQAAETIKHEPNGPCMARMP